MQSSSVVSNNNQYNALQQQENALIQDAAGAAVANAIGRPDAAGNFSQILGGLKKRQVAKKNNANLGKVASTGIAAGMNMATGMVKGIVKNAIIAVGGSADTFDHLTANPFTPPATWTGAAKVDMSKDGLKNRVQEIAIAEFLETNGMDADLAKSVAGATNEKIKAKKAKKEEKTKAIESTAQTAVSVALAAITAGAATPLLTALNTSATAANTVVTTANIGLQAAIGSRTGGKSGALAGALNGIFQSAAGGALSNAGKAVGMSQTAVDNIVAAEKYLKGVNVSYSKEDGFGIKANVTAAVQGLGTSLGFGNADAMKALFTNVTIGQSQRGGATFNLGTNLGFGTIGVSYTGSSGTFGGSYDIIERQVGGANFSSELSYDGKEGFSVSGNADFGNGYGLGIENGRNGTSGSLTILGSQQGTVDVNGNYTANENFLGEINGQDIADLADTIERQRLAEENERNPVKSAKDAADAQEVGGEEGPQGLVDLVFAGTAVLMTAAATFIAGGGSSAASPSSPAGGAGNGGNAEVPIARRREDEESSTTANDEHSQEASF
ncbi:MAG: hypothetical protein IPG24_04985 [Leptospiraceae bacterium]|nr:hypothetical protein [Leptospiraceae bacterium]